MKDFNQLTQTAAELRKQHGCRAVIILLLDEHGKMHPVLSRDESTSIYEAAKQGQITLSVIMQSNRP